MLDVVQSPLGPDVTTKGVASIVVENKKKLAQSRMQMMMAHVVGMATAKLFTLNQYGR